MKTIYNIAKAELKVLFYSPVAWLILVIFAFQSSYVFTGVFDGFINIQQQGYAANKATINLFGGWAGVFTKMQSYIYLYIPLLTMNVISRELGSGSIKLLYSSPIKNSQIILGKYLALVIFGLILTGILVVMALFAVGTIENAEIAYILSGLTGVFLLVCAYSAIGLFMSSLTAYNIVAAIGTLSILALLNFVGSMGQEYDFVRHLTYWLSLQGRSSSFISGLLTTEDVLYFIIIISLFLSLCIVRLNASRQKIHWTKTIGQYGAICVLAFGVGYLSSLPAFKKYYDTTYSKSNTLAVTSQDIVSQLDGAFTIHAYNNVLDPTNYTVTPSTYMMDYKRFEKYIRFKPETKMKYTYYYKKTHNPILERQFPGLSEEQLVDTIKSLYNWNFDILPYDSIKKDIDLENENYRFIRVLERSNGQKEILRLYDDMMKNPSESEISAAIRKLVEPSPVLGYIEGHKERLFEGHKDQDYTMIVSEKTFRYSMLNQGFDCESVNLNELVPEHIKLLFIADPETPLSETELNHLKQYINRGDNLFITGESKNSKVFNVISKLVGVEMKSGTVVQQNAKFQNDLLFLSPTHEAAETSFYLERVKRYQSVVSFPGAAPLDYSAIYEEGFDPLVLFKTEAEGYWNELETTNFSTDSVRLNPSVGEEQDDYAIVLLLSRDHHGQHQKVLVSSDADWLSNGELSMKRNGVDASNYSLVASAFNLLSEGKVPVDLRHPDPIDNKVFVSNGAWSVLGIVFKWGYPLVIALFGAILLIRRRKK